MKRWIAMLMIAVTAALLLCACGSADQEPTVPVNKYPGVYVLENSTIRERSTRTLTVNEDGTYTYERVSTMDSLNGTFTGTWTVDEEGYLVLKSDGSGLTSRAMLSTDTLKLNVADLSNGNDTVGNGIYQYQFPPKQATPDAG